MDLILVKTSTLKVLSEISDNELNTVTLPVLRERVAEAMKLPIEDLLGKEIKSVILETFQEFLLNKSSEKTEDDPKTKKSKSKKYAENSSEKIKEKEKANNKSEQKSAEKEADIKVDDGSNLTSKSSRPSKSVPSAKSLQIEKLKSYVFKCGVRKVWKKELEGLNEKQSISKIQGILRELGMEGKPSLEQCKAIKTRREFEAELREIDTSNIIEGKRRSRGSEIDLKVKTKTEAKTKTEVKTKTEAKAKTEANTKRKLVISDDEDDGGECESGSESEKSFTIDLNNFGDSESD